MDKIRFKFRYNSHLGRLNKNLHGKLDLYESELDLHACLDINLTYEE